MKHMLILLLLAGFFSMASAQNVGEPAPDFTYNTLEHGQITLSQFQGKVIYMFMFGFS